MNMDNNDPHTSVDPECKPDSIPEKKATEDGRNKVRSNLGKTLAELKNGLYRLERIPED
jgi:hypothetical protein